MMIGVILISACNIKIGDKFNRLTVIGKTSKRTSDGSVVWNCICECGNNTTCTSNCLKNGHKKSCGCLFVEENKKKIRYINDNNLKRYITKLNTYRECGDVTYILLQDGSESIIDTEDVNKVKYLTWTRYSNGYCCNANKNILMHRLIMDCLENKKMVVDHINHNILDNRKSNLRLATKQQNSFNMKKKDKGVYFDKIRGKWVSQISINGKSKHLGRFNTKEEAINKRIKTEKDIFGEFAYDYELEE